jgi:hypothetical protein
MTIGSLQLVVDVSKISNLTVMYKSRDVKKGNLNCPIGAKAKDGCNIVVMCPSIIKTFLDIRVSCCLQI